MDPITRASRQFLAEAEAFWRRGEGSLLTMVAAPSDRAELTKTLRLEELGPTNRRPLFLYEEPFEGEVSYADGLTGSLAKDYEQIRRGVQEEGVSIPRLDAPAGAHGEPASALARALTTAERISTLLGERFDGVLVALVPSQIVDLQGFRRSVVAVRGARLSPRVRFGIFDPQSDLLAEVRGEGVAHLSIDRGALDAYLRELGSSRSEGPPVAAALGQSPPSSGAPQRLKALLLDGAREGAEGRPVVAADRYREARALCAQEKLILEEALVLIALGGMCLEVGALNASIESYRQAAELAKAKKAWGVVCQAYLGVAGAELTREVYAPAALAYRAAAEAAQQGEIPALGVEARRLEGTCWLLAGSEEDAMDAWQGGLNSGAELRGKEPVASTLPAVATALAELLESRGLTAHAEHMRSVLHHISRGDDLPLSTKGAGVETLVAPSVLPVVTLPFVKRSVDPFSLGPSAPAEQDGERVTMELRISPAGQALSSTGAPADSPPGKRLVRFDSQTGEALPSPIWDDLPESPGDGGEDR